MNLLVLFVANSSPLWRHPDLERRRRDNTAPIVLLESTLGPRQSRNPALAEEVLILS